MFGVFIALYIYININISLYSFRFYEDLEVEIGSECHRNTVELGGVIDAKCDHSDQFLASNSTTCFKLGGLKVLFNSMNGALKCRDIMHGRWFDERRLDASVTGLLDNPPPMIQPISSKQQQSSSSIDDDLNKKKNLVEVVHVKKEESIKSKELSKLDRALATIQMKCAENPTNSELVANKSGILGMLGRWSEALEAADKVYLLNNATYLFSIFVCLFFFGCLQFILFIIIIFFSFVLNFILNRVNIKTTTTI